MNITWIDRLRPFLGSIIGYLVAIALVKLSSFTGYELPLGDAEIITAATVGYIISLIKTFANKKVNPQNASTTPMAVAGKIEDKIMAESTPSGIRHVLEDFAQQQLANRREER